MSLPRSGSLLPSLNVGQDNCDHRLGQQPQSVPKITLGEAPMRVNPRLASRSLPFPLASPPTVDKLTELRDAIVAHLAGYVPETATEWPLRAFTRDARADNQRAEQVVIALKRLWEALHDERQAWSREAQLQLLDHLVTRCIDEYYTMPGPPDQPGGSRGLVR
jgi:hypothetical protein